MSCWMMRISCRLRLHEVLKKLSMCRCSHVITPLEAAFLTQQMAYDLLAIPAMSSEVERAFSGAKNTLDDNRIKLGSAVFEATELEKHWLNAVFGDYLGPTVNLSGYLTYDGKAVRLEALCGN